jgi:hypothetical protein
MLAIAQFTHRFGFFGVSGIFGMLLGLIIWVILLWGLWSILGILSTKVPEEFKWLLQILKIALVVFISIAFINWIFGLGWF